MADGLIALEGDLLGCVRVFATATPQVTLKPVNLSPAMAQAVRMFAPWVGI